MSDPQQLLADDKSILSDPDWASFLTFWENSVAKVSFELPFVDMLDGNHLAALLLSQILYWHLPTKKSKKRTRLCVYKEGYYWLAKRREDWWQEVRLKPKQFDRAVTLLEKKGYVEKRIFRFDGLPMCHIRILPKKLVDDFIKNTKPVTVKMNTSNLPNSGITKLTIADKTMFPARGSKSRLTETTANTTTEITLGSDDHMSKRVPLSSDFLPLGDNQKEPRKSNPEPNEYEQQWSQKRNEIAQAFLLAYKRWQLQDHPQIKPANLDAAFSRLKQWDLEIHDHYSCPVPIAAYRVMIEKYFEDFWMDEKARFEHFCTSGILQNRLDEVIKPYGKYPGGKFTPMAEIYALIENQHK